MKISRKAYFLILIIEECAEIIHRTCKALRFGMDEKWKPGDPTNRDLLKSEITDLYSILEMNVTEGNFAPEVLEWQFNRDRVVHKKEKVRHFLDYSNAGCRTVLNMGDNLHPKDLTPNQPLCYQNWKAETR